MSDPPANADSSVPVTLVSLSLYFLRLGSTGFGGPIALAGAMQRDLVQGRRWFSEVEFHEGLAFSQLAPGPLAAQLAIYLGFLRYGVPGATFAGVAFVLPSFLMVVGLSMAYVRYGGLAWMHGVFYGVGAAVVGIIARSAVKLAVSTTRKDWKLWFTVGTVAVATAWTESEIVWLFLLSGILNLILDAVRQRRMVRLSALPLIDFAVPIHGTHTELFLFFAKASLFVFGSGLAIVPFLHSGLVVERHWLSEQQFLDAVAVAMITPGPVVITVAFIGFLVAGFSGAIVAALGVFLPVYGTVILFATHFRRLNRNPNVQSFVAGVTAAAAGAIAGSAFILGRSAITDLGSSLLAVLCVFLLYRWKVPEPALVLAAGMVGWAISH